MKTMFNLEKYVKSGKEDERTTRHDGDEHKMVKMERVGVFWKV